ncbi:hypothetical protein FX988_02179 [Paraglaciecola mesophila]|uniref:Uncharacterized protein n=1 Tax=Paraglaciecola mesophila TaxID=197222 RepID=A0A857JJ30_9ALTE|nr:hypothetical protein FX988_02179 [Paraglaciecola mesophila]
MLNCKPQANVGNSLPKDCKILILKYLFKVHQQKNLATPPVINIPLAKMQQVSQTAFSTVIIGV